MYAGKSFLFGKFKNTSKDFSVVTAGKGRGLGTEFCSHERWEAGGGLRWELAASSSIFSLLWAEALDHAAGPGEGRDPSTP